MPADAVPRCPECTYVLTGLTVPRCPECGLEFPARLLSDPALAVPRPAWERWPRVSLLWAFWDTLVQVTFRPRTFFASIQQPDCLRRSVYWALCIIAAIYLLVVGYAFASMRMWNLGGVSSGIPPFQIWRLLVFIGTAALFPGVLLLLLPNVTMLLIADLLFWRDRERFRIFFKGVMYTTTVYLWLAVSVGAVRTLLQALGPATRDWLWYGSMDWPWASWLTAGAVTWQYAIVYHAVLGPRYAMLLTPRPGHKAILALLVIAGWLTATYLTLLDNYVGLRFATADWSWGAV